MKQSTASLILKILILMLAATSVFLSTIGPAVAPEDAPVDQFSALRALKHVKAIAKKPHAMGTAQHEEVRRYLISEINALGLNPEIQTTTIVRSWSNGGTATNLSNVMARLIGREKGKAVLLVGHYDNAPNSFGAADNGAAVAAMLETLRILKADSQLRNDVIFLFTDAEEFGLLGAQAFVERHPWAEEVGMVINLDARGTSGPVFMFETNPGNGLLVMELRRAVIHPVAASLSSDVYRRMPNRTDFTIFNQHGLLGLNFAFIHGGTAYHTPQDSLERLDLRSLQHHGEYALGLARQFGEADLSGDWANDRNAIYFNIMGSFFLSYTGALVLPLSIFLAFGTIGFLLLGFRWHRLTCGGLLIGIVAILAGALVSGLLILLLSRLVFTSNYNFVLWNNWTSNSLNLFGLALITIGLTVAIYRLIARKINAGHLVGAGLLLWLVLTAVISFAAPGGSYLYALPLLLTLGTNFLWLRNRPPKTVPITLFIFLTLSAAAVSLLWPPTLALLGVALGSQTALPIAISIFLLLVCLMTPHLELMNPRRRGWILPIGAIIVGALVITAVVSVSGYSAENRKPNQILYVLDIEAGEASWLSFDTAPDAWTSQFLGEAPERAMAPEFLGSGSVLRNTAPIVALDGAEVELLSEDTAGEVRVLQIRIDWPFQVHRALIRLRSPGEIRKVSISGQEIGVDSDGASLIYNAPPQEGIELSIELAGEESLDVEAVCRLLFMPELAKLSYKPRPAHMMAGHRMGRVSDSTLIRSVTILAPDAKANP